MRTLPLLVLALVWLVSPPAIASGESMILVARPQLEHPVYARSVVVVAPFGADQHYGFIVNRPTALRLGEMFPQYAPARAVTDPVFLGGPVYAGYVFALVEGEPSPGRGCLRMMPGLHAVFAGRAVDQVIESRADDARFVTGLVVWRPGELAREIAGGAWDVLSADASLLSREPRGLWEELAWRARRLGEVRATSAALAHGR